MRPTVDVEVRRIAAIPAESRFEVCADVAAFEQQLNAQYPQLPTEAPGVQDRIWEMLSEINPGLEPAGYYYLDAGKESQESLALSVPQQDGRVRVVRYELIADFGILFPPFAWLVEEAQKRPGFKDESDAGWQARTYLLSLPKALREDVPLSLYITVEGERVLSAWALTPTIHNIPHRVLVKIDTPEAGRFNASLHLAIPIGSEVDQLELGLSLKYKGESIEGICNGQRKTGPRATRIFETFELSPWVAPLADALPGNWPWMLGPLDGCSSEQNDVPVVERMQDATLAWTGDHVIPCGRGPDTRGRLKRIDNEPLSGGWASPVVWDNRIYLYYYIPSGTAYALGAEKEASKKGEYRPFYDLNLIDADDVIHCFDARSGRSIWRRSYAQAGLNWSSFNKSGPQLSPCTADGRIFAMGTSMRVYGIDAQTGKTLWVNHIGQRHKLQEYFRGQLKRNKQLYGSRSDGSSSLVVAGNTVLCCDHVRTKGGDGYYRYEQDNGFVAFDVRTGKRIWTLPESGSSATRWVHGDKAYFIVAGRNTIRCVAPEDGRELWRYDGGGAGDLPLSVSDDRLICRLGQGEESRIGCLKLSLDHAELAWVLEQDGLNLDCATVLYQGHAYISSRRGSILCVELISGKVIGQADPGGGLGLRLAGAGIFFQMPDQSHVKGDMHLYRADPKEFRHLSTWHAPLAGAYTTPWHAPLIDGRLFLRLSDRLVCYDLRANRTRPDFAQAGLIIGSGVLTPTFPPPAKSKEIKKIELELEIPGLDLD